MKTRRTRDLVLLMAAIGCLSLSCSPHSSEEEASPTPVVGKVTQALGTTRGNPQKVDIDKIVGTASKIVSVYSAAFDLGLTIGRLTGLIEEKDVFEEIEALGQQVHEAARSQSWLATQAAREDAIRQLEGKIIFVSDELLAGREVVWSDIGDDANDLVNAVSSPTDFIRYYIDTDTSGPIFVTKHGIMHWKNAIPYTTDDLKLSNGHVYDWRIGAPALMYAISLRVQLMAMQDENFAKNGTFYNQAMHYRDALEVHRQMMEEGLKCSGIILRPHEGGERPLYPDGVNEDSYTVLVACADIYTGIHSIVHQTFSRFDPILSRMHRWDDHPVYDCDSACLEVLQPLYDDWLDTNVYQVMDRLRIQVLNETPHFQLTAMIDSLYMIATGAHDLTERTRGQIRSYVSSSFSDHLCLQELEGSTFSAVEGIGIPAGVPCAFANEAPAAQRWSYDREAQTIVNVASGLCLTAPDCEYIGLAEGGACPEDPDYPPPGFTAITAPCVDGDDAQKWTFAADTHALYNGRGLYLDVRPNEHSVQVLESNWRRNWAGQRWSSYQTFLIDSDFGGSDVWIRGDAPVVLRPKPGEELEYGFTSELGNTYSEPIILPEGESTIYFRSVSAAGVASPIESQTYRVDTVPPSATVSLSASTSTLTFVASDPAPSSGIAGTRVVVYVGETALPSELVAGSEGSLSIDPEFTRIEYWAVDIAGNEQERQTAYRYPLTVESDGPLGYWRLGDADMTAVDATDRHNDGTYTASHAEAFLPYRGQAGAIANDPDYSTFFHIHNRHHLWPVTQHNWVTVPPHEDYAPAEISLEAWFSMTPGKSPATFASIVSKGNGVHADGYGLYWFPSYVYFYVGWQASRVGVPLASLGPLGTINHIVGTYDGTAARVYLNGNLVATQSMPGRSTASSAPLHIGRGPYWGWQGIIDEVAVYGRVLDDKAVENHYRAGKGLPPIED